MKFTKLIGITAIALSCIMSTAHAAIPPSEGLCYSVVSIGNTWKEAMKDGITTVDKEIALINKEQKHDPDLQRLLKNVVYFTANNIKLPSDTFDRLLYLRCMAGF